MDLKGKIRTARVPTTSIPYFAPQLLYPNSPPWFVFPSLLPPFLSLLCSQTFCSLTFIAFFATRLLFPTLLPDFYSLFSFLTLLPNFCSLVCSPTSIPYFASLFCSPTSIPYHKRVKKLSLVGFEPTILKLVVKPLDHYTNLTWWFLFPTLLPLFAPKLLFPTFLPDSYSPL